MARPISLEKFATKKELEQHKKQVVKLIKYAVKDVKKWDVKQDKSLIKKSYAGRISKK
jgi:hypothetical protein